MKHLLFVIFILCGAAGASAQNSFDHADDEARIQLTAVVPAQVEGMTESASSMLKNKIGQIVSKNGLGGSNQNSRFIVVANVVVLTKDITPTAPPMQAYTLEVTFYMGDGVEGTLFSTASVTLKGVGETETKAYISALKNLKVDSPKYQDFINQGKQRIIEYYNTQCEFILYEAEMLASTKDYDSAIAKLTAVPKVCKDCYDLAMMGASAIYKSKLEYECQLNISNANVAIAQDKWNEAANYLTNITPDLSCYSEAKAIIKNVEEHQCSVALGQAKAAWSSRNFNEAAKHLGKISADSKCAQEANELAKEIAAKVDEKEKREWDLAYEKYDRSQTLKETLDVANVELEKLRIEQARAVGIERARNQPQTISYNYVGWW